MRWSFVSATALLALSAASAVAQSTQLATSSGAFIAPFAGYLNHGAWFDGPLSTTIRAAGAPVAGAQVGVPLMKGVSLTGSVAYSSGDLEIGVPFIGGIDVGTNRTWMYDVALEVGGLSRTQKSGIAPFVQGGIGGMTNNVTNQLLDVHSTNLAYIAGAGVDMRVTRSVALRLQARDYIGRFDSQEAVGFKVNGNLAHNWALGAGVKLAFP